MLPNFSQLSLCHNAQEPTGAPRQDLDTILEAQALLIKRLNESQERAKKKPGVPEHASAAARRDPAERDPYEQHPLRYEPEQKHRVTVKESVTCKNPGCSGKNVHEVSDGRAVCEECGVEQVYASEDMAARSLADDTEKARLDRIHNELYRGDERHHMTHIEDKEFPNAVNQANLDLANQRLNQCRAWFVHYLSHTGVLREYGFWLTESEITKALRLLRAACKQWALGSGYPGQPFGSPIFWVLALTLQMVSNRPQGFNVPNVRMQNLLTMSGLHLALKHHQGTRVTTDESEQSATRASGSGTAGQNYLDAAKSRHVRWDPLGNEVEQLKKMVFLNLLLVEAQMTPLSSVVLNFDRPGLIGAGNDDFMNALVTDGNYKLVASRNSDPVDTEASVVERVFAQLRL